jgi:hypothetical protein
MTDDVTGETTDQKAGSAPFLRIVKGDPTPEELAALVAVLAATSSAAWSPPSRPTPAWNAPRRLHRVVHPHGPTGWRASGLPR